uniref:Pol-like protein n=1 Tax=Phallusia mammillata TaxID=59560 RepID=A0A6F9DMX7_9ASCI|nr:pol-like protein [Phallusia mammillata]
MAPTSYLKICTLNVNGIGQASKRHALFRHLSSLNFDLFCLQETHSTPQTESLWKSEWTSGPILLNSAPHKGSASGGVAVLLNSSSISILNSISDSTGRIITTDISTRTHTIHIVNIYAPSGSKNHQARNTFFDSLYPYINSPHPIILTGDFNCVENPSLDRYPPSHTHPPNKTLQNLLTTFHLQDSFRLLHPTLRQFTRRAPNTQSRIDRIYISPALTPKQHTFLPTSLSDHDLVILTLNLVSAPPRGRGTWKNNVNTLHDPHFQKHLRQLYPVWKTLAPFHPNPLDFWLTLKVKFKKLIQTHSKRIAQEQRTHTHNLQTQLNTLRQTLNDDPSSENYKTFLAVKKSLATLHLDTARSHLIKSLASDPHFKHMADKTLYSQLLPSKRHPPITELENDLGLPLTTPKEMLSHTHRFFTDLYSDQNKPIPPPDNIFLKQPLNPIPEDQTQSLSQPLSKSEIKNTISLFPNGKTPGPDGLSIEFYSLYWDLIGADLTQALDHAYLNAYTPLEFNLGHLTLIHKKNNPSLLTNYRPISLLNADLKILQKTLNLRIKPFLSQIISQNQFAQPNSTTSDATTLLRDLFHEATSRSSDSFFVSLDFQKAFDSISYTWLKLQLTRKRFPPTFVNYILSLQTTAYSHTLLNGFATTGFPIRRGVRQGDPLSLTLFLIAIDPLLAAIQNHPSISPVPAPCRNTPKAIAFADDVTLAVAGSHSLETSFQLISRFTLITGLALNPTKTQAIATLCPPNSPNLPDINWNPTVITPLNIPIGHPKSITAAWRNAICSLKETSTSLKHPFLTYDAKSILTKTLLLPKLSYLARTYPLPPTQRETVDGIVVDFISAYPNPPLPIKTLSARRDLGGYDVANIPLYTDIFFLAPLRKYLLHRIFDTPTTPQLSLLEYHVGHPISRLFNLRTRNYLPHSNKPSPFYQTTLSLLAKLNPTQSELLSPKSKPLYTRLVNPDPDPTNPTDWSLIHHPIHPNYIKTFNYRLKQKTLPLHCKFTIFFLDKDTNCYLCNTHFETYDHLFHTCPQIQSLLTLAKKIFTKTTGNPTTYFDTPSHYEFIKPDHPSASEHTLISLLNSTLSHAIWKTRNKIKAETHSISPTLDKDLARSLIRSLHSKLSIQRNRPNSIHLEVMANAVKAINLIKI